MKFDYNNSCSINEQKLQEHLLCLLHKSYKPDEDSASYIFAAHALPKPKVSPSQMEVTLRDGLVGLEV